jgi:hypothetical protein
MISFRRVFPCLQTTLYMYCAGIFKQSMGARNRVGIEFSYRPARLHRLAELIPWDQLLSSLEVKDSVSEFQCA